MRGLAARRSEERRHKDKSRKLGKDVWRMPKEWLTPKWINHMAATHNKPCSCGSCKYDSREQAGPTLSELRKMTRGRRTYE
jgi:hypothetical protein